MDKPVPAISLTIGPAGPGMKSVTLETASSPVCMASTTVSRFLSVLAGLAARVSSGRSSGPPLARGDSVGSDMSTCSTSPLLSVTRDSWLRIQPFTIFEDYFSLCSYLQPFQGVLQRNPIRGAKVLWKRYHLLYSTEGTSTRAIKFRILKVAFDVTQAPRRGHESVERRQKMRN